MIHEKGEYFGELNLVESGKKRGMTATALIECHIVCLD